MNTKKRIQLRRSLVAYSFIAPNFIGFALFTLVPMLFALVLSVMKWDGSPYNPMTFAGFRNFIKLFDDTQFTSAFKNTIVYTVFTVPGTLVMSLLLAVLMNQSYKGKLVFRTIFFFPYVASMVAVTAVWNMLFNPGMGPVNELLRALGMVNPPGWSADKDWAMATIVMFSIWKYMGYYMIIYLAGLQGINPELYEAADLDGCTGIQKFFRITVPQLSATTFFVLMMLIIQCFKVYDIVYMITQGGPGTSTLVMVYDIYNKAFINSSFGMASAEAILLFLLVLIITLVQFRGEKKFGEA
jgi:multiple sugar transport system permease protein